jgi:phosphoglucosamine mutase
VIEGGYDAGFAFDGDGDRLLAVDRRGAVVDGDELMALVALHLRGQDRLLGGGVAVTVMTNFGFHQAMQDAGIEVATTPVGDRHVLAELLRRGWGLGGEQSGHIIDRLVHTTGDGIHTALVFGYILSVIGEPFSKLHTFDPMPQLLLNQKVGSKPSLETLPRYQTALASALASIAGRGRILVRYSGTENLVRVMVEGEDDSQIRAIAEELRNVLRDEIG